MLPQPSISPFVYGPMIRDAQRFFGRQAERRQLLSRVRTMQHTSIVGERRIGKSSLLFRLYEEAKQTMPDAAIVYSDLPQVADKAAGRHATPEDVQQALAAALKGGDLVFSSIWQWLPRGEQKLLALIAAGGAMSTTDLARKL